MLILSSEVKPIISSLPSPFEYLIKFFSAIADKLIESFPLPPIIVTLLLLFLMESLPSPPLSVAFEPSASASVYELKI